MNEDAEPIPVRTPPPAKRYAVYAGVMLVVFLLGFVPMWLKARTSSDSLAKAEHQLTVVGMQGDIASAAIDAQRGDYEPARQAASRFFTSLRAEVDKGDASAFTQAQRGAMTPLFAGRDEVITLLARSDPAVAARLADLYVEYRKVVSAQGGS